MRYNPFAPVSSSDTAVITQGTSSAPLEVIVAEATPNAQATIDGLLIAAYGVPDAPWVEVGKDEMAVVAQLRYDGSVPQCDHFDRHAAYGYGFCVAVVSGRARTEAIARRCLRTANFSEADWTWHSETHGHGNYLMGPGFELPPELQGWETAGINRTPVRHVRWQIEFLKGYGQPFSIRPFKSYGVGGQGTTLAAIVDSSGVPPASLRENRAKQGIEIKFDRKPSEAVLEPLRTKWPTWKWSRFSAVWYAKDHPENRAWAQKFLENLSTGVPPACNPETAAVINPSESGQSDGRIPTGAARTGANPVTSTTSQPPPPVADPTRECVKCGETCEETKIIAGQAICGACEENMKVFAQLPPTAPPPLDLDKIQNEIDEIVPAKPAVVVLDNPPPGGWTPADRVPDKYRRGYVAPILLARQPSSSNPQPIISKLPPRRRFVKE